MTEREFVERLTVQDLATLEETPYIRELIDGKLFMVGSPAAKHQRLVGNLYFYLRQIVPSGELMLAPMDVILDEYTVLQPDIFWVAEGSACVEIDGVFRGAPDLVIEVLSPTTARRDTGIKFRKYEASGVRKYWQVNAEQDLSTVWVLREGVFRQLDVYGVEGTLASPTLGMTINLANVLA